MSTLGDEMGQVAYETLLQSSPGFIDMANELLRLGQTPKQIVYYIKQTKNPSPFMLSLFENAIRFMYKEMISERTT